MSAHPIREARRALRLLFAPAALVGLVFGTTAAPLRAQADIPPWYFVFEPPFSPSDGLGQHVATDGTVIAALDTRHVALYARTATWPSWALQAVVPVWSDWPVGAGIPSGLAVDQDRLLIGETAATGYPAGAVRVLHRSGTAWPDDGLLVPGDGLPGDGFGTSVDLEGATLVVGAPGHGPGGAAYVFQLESGSWVQRAQLTGTDVVAGDGFGTVVALSGDVITVGAPHAVASGQPDKGAAWVFSGAGSTWVEQARLIEPVPAPYGGFASSLDVDGDCVLVGSPGADTSAAPGAGAGYVWARNGTAWIPQGQLAATDSAAQPADGTGFSVALRDGTAFLGAPFSTFGVYGAVSFAGSVLRFERSGSTWTYLGRTGLIFPASGQVLGWSVAAGADTLVAGVPGWGLSGGAVYEISVGEQVPAWLDVGYGLAGAAGVPRLAGDGPLTAGSPGAVTLDHAAPAALALLLVATTENPVPFKGGTLVPVPAQVPLFLVTDTAGAVTLRWSAFPAGLPSWSVQYAVVDAGAPHGVALSNALAATPQ